MRLVLQLLVILLLTQNTFSQAYQGFFNFNYEEGSGKLLLQVDKLNQDFLMVSAYGTGLGSNDIGMDRGRLGDIRIVRFEKQGDKILLIQSNTAFRAKSNNPLEIKAVTEAFAESVIYGFKIEKKENNSHFIDIAPLLLDDLNLVAVQLKEGKQGVYKVDKSRSALFFENTHAFPKNIEFESILTFAGEPAGEYIKQVTPSPEYVSYRQHISFIELPDNNYVPRAFHPECGYFYTSYFDYATPVFSPLEKKWITRHRLQKKISGKESSEVITPIIYYIDPGCPEPIKSALVEGGKWWAQAFEAAGFKNAFDVKELPEGAHPLDVRYNMIQWVHRSTRGWSYGSSITDPRTGEIIKGHVSLGSLRVRQDFMIAQGILSPYSQDDDNHKVAIQMALDRLKQLSAHEIGHTLGLAHNFAASTNDRASVMDYPHPYVALDKSGNFDFAKAYDDKIGLWDKRAIIYGYSEFGSEEMVKNELEDIILENHRMGLRFLTDEDARSLGSASPVNHLWDNGADAVDELNRIIALRAKALSNFGLNSIPKGTPVSELEKVLVPLYFMHRYQAEATGKLIGGLEYHYAVKGFGKIEPLKPIPAEKQEKALESLLALLQIDKLGLPADILPWLYPPAYGYPRTRESFPTSASPAFDKTRVEESASGQIIDILMNADRLQRLYNQNTLLPYLMKISDFLADNQRNDAIKHMAEIQFITKIRTMSIAEHISHSLKSVLNTIIQHHSNTSLKVKKSKKTPKGQPDVHLDYILNLLSMKPESVKDIKLSSAFPLPPGAPIGSCDFE